MMDWLWELLDNAWFLITCVTGLMIVASAALCPLLIATVIVEVRELRQIVDSTKQCECRRSPLPLPLPHHRFRELLDD